MYLPLYEASAPSYHLTEGSHDAPPNCGQSGGSDCPHIYQEKSIILSDAVKDCI